MYVRIGLWDCGFDGWMDGCMYVAYCERAMYLVELDRDFG